MQTEYTANLCASMTKHCLATYCFKPQANSLFAEYYIFLRFNHMILYCLGVSILWTILKSCILIFGKIIMVYGIM